MVLAEAAPAQRLAAGAFEIEAGGVHEHEVEPAEQIAPHREQALLDEVLHAARREGGAAGLLLSREVFAEPGHGAVEMVEIEVLGAFDAEILAPAVGGAIGTATDEPVQDGQEHRPLQVEGVLAQASEFGDHGPAAGLLPQAFEDERRSDAPGGDRRGRIVAGGLQDHGLGGEAGTRAQQAFELARGDELIEPAEGCDDLLAHLGAGASALDDLQVGTSGGLFLAEVHGRLRASTELPI